MIPLITTDDPSATGPIRTARNIEVRRALDRAGSIAFGMPTTDPKAAQIAEKRAVSIYGLVGDVRTAVGEGVIDNIDVSDDEDSVSIQGNDILCELMRDLVDGLEIAEDVTSTLTAAQEVETGVGSVDLPNAIDGNVGTMDTITLVTAPNLKYLYVGYVTTFASMTLNLGAQVNNNAATLTAQYFNGRGWIALSSITDGTASGGATLAQDGTISWTRPSDWTEVEHSSQSLFWMRFYPSADLDSVDIVEIDVSARTPTRTAPQLIMAYAPAGWSLDTGDWYDETATDVYHVFEDNTTVLAALVFIAELTGEHFRLGEGREIEWMRADQPASGLRAVRVAPSRIASNDDVVIIQSFERVTDSYDVFNRIYPYGAGLGAARLTLAGCTESAPAGYTLDIANNFIEKDSATPRISRSEPFQEIRAVDASATGDVHAPNQLFRAALARLQRNDAAHSFYTVKVIKLTRLIKPGATIHVVYRRVVGSYVARNVNAHLLILEVTNEISEQGVLSATLLLGTIDRYPATDARVQLRQMQSGARVRGSVQRVHAGAMTSALNSLKLLKA
jgi:hypothetical protein